MDFLRPRLDHVHISKICPHNPSQSVFIPFFDIRIPAGFPSPADDYLDHALDLNDLLIEHPVATFYVRVQGDSMEGAGIHSGDILVVDRALEPRHSHIVVAVMDGEFTIKRLWIEGNTVRLVAENRTMRPLEITEDTRFEVWGVVTYAIHPIK